jgi:hypothetical protein
MARATALAPLSATRRRRTSASTSFLTQALETAAVVVGQHHPLETSGFLGGAKQAGQEGVGLELTERLERVIANSDGPSRLHAGEAAHGRSGERRHQLRISFHERLERQLRQFMRGHPLADVL